MIYQNITKILNIQIGSNYHCYDLQNQSRKFRKMKKLYFDAVFDLSTVLFQGGFKAVVWTDTLQALIMFLGSAVLCVQGTILAGGPSKVWEAALRGQRMNLLK